MIRADKYFQREMGIHLYSFYLFINCQTPFVRKVLLNEIEL